MTCRHSPGDPNCGSYARESAAADARELERLKAEAALPKTPDAENYEITEVKRCGEHLVMKVRYPNCSNCAYEGNKVMVFLNVTEADVIRWRRIDPHFKDPKAPRQPRQAPSPAARFPGSPEGWADAVAYAHGKMQAR